MEITTASSAGDAAFAACQPITWEERPLPTTGWLRLTVSSSQEDWPYYAGWLDSPSPSNLPLTNGQLLTRVVDTIALGLREIAAPHPLPDAVRYIVRFAPRGCRYTEQHRFASPATSFEIGFPIVFESIRQSQFDATALVIEHLTLLVAHESTHLVQMHPFTADRAERMTSDAIAFNGGHAMGFRVEFEARLIDYCLKQAIVPDGPRRRAFMTAWLNEQNAGGDRWSALQSDRAARLIHQSLFETLRQTQGDTFGSVTADALEALFPLCVAAMNGRLSPGSTLVPTETEVVQGRRALSAIRATLPRPIEFPASYY